MEDIDNNIARKVLMEYLKISGREDFISPLTGNYTNDLFVNYAQVKGLRDEDIFLSLFVKYKFNYSYSIMNGMCYLFGKGSVVERVNPFDWPGMISVDKDNNKYILHTLIGDIEVYKASEIFSGTNSSFIFKKKLVHQCFSRTYDFVKKNKDFNAVVSLLDGPFRGGYYHAYAVNGNTLVDPAVNTIYIDPKVIAKLYKGKEIIRLSYDEISDRFSKIKKMKPDIDNGCILSDVALPNIFR